MNNLCADCMKSDVCKNCEQTSENLEKLQLTLLFQELTNMGINTTFRCSHFVLKQPNPRILGNSNREEN